MKKTIAARTVVSPRMTAERFGASPWLAVTVFCLAFSCALTLASAVQGVMHGAEVLSLISGVFNLVYVFASGAAVYFIWQIRASVTRDKCRKAGTGALALGIALLLTALFLALFYFSAYTAMGSLSAEDMAEMEITQEYIDQMWTMVPYYILSLAATAMEGIAFLVFRQVFVRLGDMSMGKSASSGIFTGCAAVAALAGGLVLGRMLFDLVMSRTVAETVFAVIGSAVDAGIYAGIMMVCQGTASALRGE